MTGIPLASPISAMMPLGPVGEQFPALPVLLGAAQLHADAANTARALLRVARNDAARPVLVGADKEPQYYTFAIAS